MWWNCSVLSRIRWFFAFCDKGPFLNLKKSCIIDGLRYVWPLIGSKFAKNSWKLDKVDKTRCTWPCQAKNRYDVTLANRRAPGVWFVLGFKMYLFLAPKWPGIPFLEKILQENWCSKELLPAACCIVWYQYAVKKQQLAVRVTLSPRRQGLVHTRYNTFPASCYFAIWNIHAFGEKTDHAPW